MYSGSICFICSWIWNAAQFARSLGVTEPTVRRYLDVLAGTHMVRVLQPWYVNLRKRQVKAPKVYLRDSGLLHALLGLASEREMLAHPKTGASWEGFAIETVLDVVRPEDQPRCRQLVIVHFFFCVLGPIKFFAGWQLHNCIARLMESVRVIAEFFSVMMIPYIHIDILVLPYPHAQILVRGNIPD